MEDSDVCNHTVKKQARKQIWEGLLEFYDPGKPGLENKFFFKRCFVIFFFFTQVVWLKFESEEFKKSSVKNMAIDVNFSFSFFK